MTWPGMNNRLPELWTEVSRDLRVLMRGAPSRMRRVLWLLYCGPGCGDQVILWTNEFGRNYYSRDVAAEQIAISPRRVMDAGLADRSDYVHESATDLPQEDEGSKVGDGDDIGHQQTRHICRTLKRQHAVAIPCVLFA
jgi:hypothetical protein